MRSSIAVNSFREILAHGAVGADFAAGFETTLSQGIVLVTMNILLEFSPRVKMWTVVESGSFSIPVTIHLLLESCTFCE